MKTCDSKFHQCLYFASHALARKVEKLAVASWKPVGLSPSHAYLLLLVLEEPGIQPTTVSDQLQLTPSTITRLVEKLELKKMVVRTTEGKLTNIYPTPKAKSMLPEMQQCLQQFYTSYHAILGEQGGQELVSNICKMADKIGT